FPASMPLYFLVQAYILRKIQIQFINFRRIPSEIYLLEDGQTLQIVWLKQFYRKLKEDPIIEQFHISQLLMPQGQDQVPLRGDLFPEVYPFQDYRPLNYAWFKYFTTQQNFFIFQNIIIISILRFQLMYLMERQLILTKAILKEQIMNQRINITIYEKIYKFFYFLYIKIQYKMDNQHKFNYVYTFFIQIIIHIYIYIQYLKENL
ncbi:hypothetical protein IMG5_107550, partial [Ichthyophthirius multifiliis]